MICSSEYRNAFLALFGRTQPQRPTQLTGDSPTAKFSSNIAGRVVRTIRLSLFLMFHEYLVDPIDAVAQEKTTTQSQSYDRRF